MKPIPNDIVLRPRFQLELSEAKEELLTSFEKLETAPFVVTRLDEHIFIKFNKKSHHFWSPQLHLEIDKQGDHQSSLYGVFGPDPTFWTLFMFLHFGVATVFIVLAVWAYSSAALDKSYSFQLSLMGIMIILWFVLYFFGRIGKQKGKPQMEELYRFMMNVINKHKINHHK